MNRSKSFWALVLLVPAPSIGALAAMVLFPGTLLGKILFAASKLWLFVFPVIWLKFIDKERLGISPARNGGWVMGLVSGLGLSLLIILGFLVFGPSLFDPSVFITKIGEIGLGSLPVYLGGATYWILINSVLEEYVWRWFVYRQCETLVKPMGAVLLTSMFFSLHHFIALQVYLSLPVAVLCSVGVFLGGAIWSGIYLRYRSIWPGYLSHALVDLALFGLGAVLLFGSH